MSDTVNGASITSEEPTITEFYSIPPLPLPVSIKEPALPVREHSQETSVSLLRAPPTPATVSSTEDLLTPPELPSRPSSQPKYVNLPLPEVWQSRETSPAPSSDDNNTSYAIPPVA